MSQTHEGAMKARAASLGLSVEELQAKLSTGERYCYRCHQWLSCDLFGRDVSRWDGFTRCCLPCKRASQRATHKPVEVPKKGGPAPLPPRDGDKRQARARVNLHVRTGRWEPARALPCVDCGHLWSPGETDHEYDHYLGYGAEHHEHVQPLCIPCHHKREVARRRSNGC